MKRSKLLEFGFTIAGMLFGIAFGMWTCLCFFYGKDGHLGQRIAGVFVILGIILLQVVRHKAGQKQEKESDA